MFVNRNMRGLGDWTTDITDAMPDAYSDTSTVTGLPVLWEMGLFGLAALAVWSVTKRTGRAVRKRTKSTLSKAARAL